MLSKQLNLLSLIIGLALMYSCSEDEMSDFAVQEVNQLAISRTISDEGRFDKMPFQWDYSFSTDSLTDNFQGVVIYPVKEIEDSLILNRSIQSIRRGTTNRRGERTGRIINGRIDYGGRRPGTGSTSSTSSSILINQPEVIYVGAAFPESEFGKNFSKELLYPRNPIDISTSFPDSYIGEITKETGGLGYKKFLKEVLRSEEYKKFIQNGSRESLDFQCSEFFSYSDIEKAFSSNVGLAKLFSSKVQSNSVKKNIKSRLLGQLISRNFTVTMEVPARGFFKDKAHDLSSENPVYVRSISYGKIALLAIESEYSFEEVKKAVEAGIKWKILNTGGSFSSKDTEILQKSSITLYLISDDTSGQCNQFFNSLDDIKKAFQLNYSETNFGLPIFCKGYYTKDNSLFTVANNFTRPSNPRPTPTRPTRPTRPRS